MAVATEEKFEAVGFVSDLSTNENKFTATLQDGTKLSGFKTKQDGSEAKVWPLVKQSLADEKYFKWTGNLRHGDKGQTYRNVTWGFEVEEGPGPQPNYTHHGEEADEPTPDHHEFAPRVPNSGQPERISSSDLPPEIAKPLEGAHKASQAMQNGRKDDRNASFALSYSKDIICAIVGTHPEPHTIDAIAMTLSLADTFKEWLDQQQQPQ